MDIEILTPGDLLTLREGQWLNDSIINFYLSALLENEKGFKYIPTYGANTLGASKLPKFWYWKFEGNENIMVPAFLYSNHWLLYYVEIPRRRITIIDSYNKKVDDKKIEFFDKLL